MQILSFVWCELVRWGYRGKVFPSWGEIVERLELVQFVAGAVAVREKKR